MDSDLNSLLDDALADFDKPVATSTSKNESNQRNQCESASKNEKKLEGKNDEHNTPLVPPSDIFKEFFSEEMSGKLEEEWMMAMKELTDESPAMMEQFFKATTSVPTEQTDAETSNSSKLATEKTDLNTTMKNTLQSLSKSMKDNSEAELGPDFMEQFANMGFSDNGSGDVDELGMMEGLMKSMLSKEMMYPPMKELCGKYPVWLQENDSKLSDEQRENYHKQLDCLTQICKEFETDNSENHFENIMELVNRMQQYGEPPEELAAKNNPIINPEEACIIS